MGGKSTSHSAVLGSKKQDASAFNLHSWQGLTEVLRRGKESLRDQTAYAEFRNLVLQYAQQGGDAELRKKIDAIIETFPRAVTDQDAPVPEMPNDGEAEGKKKSDGPHHSSTKVNVPENTKKPPASQEKPSVSPQNRRGKPMFKTLAPSKASTPDSIHEPPASLPTKQEENAAPHSSALDERGGQSEAPPAPAPMEERRPLEQHAPEVPQPEGGIKTIEEHKRRISEIKRAVHEKVGNPTTLVDSYHELGREYMMALLAALKATGPGGKESPDSAMLRLENAFKALLDTPPTPSQGDPVREEARMAPSQEEKEETVKESGRGPENTHAPSAEEPAKVTTQPTKTKDIRQPITEAPPTAQKKEVKPLPDQKTLMPTRGTPAQEKQPVRPPAPSASSAPPTPRKTIAPQVATTERKPLPRSKGESDVRAQKSPRSPAHTLTSLLTEKDRSEKKPEPERALHEIPPERVASSVQNNLPKTKRPAPPKPSETGYKSVDAERRTDAPAPARQTELSSPEVSMALDELLQEWSLFKSSGILGIGPSGAEHPLYKKLAPLSMAEVMAGRWEGSNRQVTKTIKEYVNAWRHEQGIAYNIQETFEHYLRRVVFRIRQRMHGTNHSA